MTGCWESVTFWQPLRLKLLRLLYLQNRLAVCVNKLRDLLSLEPNISFFRLRESRADPASNAGGGAISVIFVGQVSLGVHCCKRDVVYVTTLLWQNNGRQNGFTTDRAGQYIGRYIFVNNSPASIAIELPKPSTDAASLLGSIKKKYLI